MAVEDYRPTRRQVLAGLAAGVATVRHPALGASDRAALRAIAAARGVLYGSTIAAGQVEAGDDFTDLVRRECAALVTENELKWGNICDAPDEYDFVRADAIIDLRRRMPSPCAAIRCSGITGRRAGSANCPTRPPPSAPCSTTSPPSPGAIAAACVSGMSSTSRSSRLMAAPTGCAARSSPTRSART